MESKAISVSLAKNPRIAMKIIPGHFSTSNAHSNNYLDFNEMKCNASIAREVARELAIPYLAATEINTIVCMEKTAIIGAFLAEELVLEGTSINSGSEIHIVSPMSNMYGNLVFPSSRLEWINGKNILVLVTTVSSGRTLNSAMECIMYYGGRLVGISTLYKASSEEQKYGFTQQKINSLFTADDITGYKLYSPAECEMCKSGQKLDAIISSEGYTKIE